MSLFYKLLLIAVLASGAVFFSPTAQANGIKTPTFTLPSEVSQSTTMRIDGSESMAIINQALKQRLLKDNINLAVVGCRSTSLEKAKGLVEIPLNWHPTPWLWLFLPLIGTGLLLQATLNWLKHPTYDATTQKESKIPTLKVIEPSPMLPVGSEPQGEDREGPDAIAPEERNIEPYTEAARLAALEQFTEALPYFAQTVTQSPEFVAGWIGLGMALVQTKQFEAALVSFDRAIALSPDLPEVWVAKGEALTALGRTEEAQTCFERAGVAPIAPLVEALTEPISPNLSTEESGLEDTSLNATLEHVINSSQNL